MKTFFNNIRKYGVEQIFYISATIASAGVHFVFSIYVKAFVSPLEYGMYSACLLLQTYMSYLQLGTLNAFNRDYPQRVGAGEKEKCEQYRNTVFSFLLTVFLLAGFLAIGIVLIVSKVRCIDVRYTIGLILMVVITIDTKIENYGSYRCRIDKGFKYISFTISAELLSVPISFFLVRDVGYYAIFINSILAMIIGVVFYYNSSFKDFKYVLDKELLFSIVKTGMPLLISGLIWTVVNSIDKFVILGFINTEALRVYGIAQNAFTYMILIPTAMSQIFLAQMGKEYGRREDVNVLSAVSMKFSAILAAVTSMIALIAYFFLPVLVDSFMPSYSDGVAASQILILGLSIYAATLINGNILTILKKNGALLLNSVLVCLFNVVCSIGYVFVFGSKIESVALGTSTSYIFCTFVIIYQVHKYAKADIGLIIKASVMPVCISLIPGIVFFNLIENKIGGFAVAVCFVILFYGFFYRKQILSIAREEQR